jgi:uncharacterized protein (TIGR02145 family)
MKTYNILLSFFLILMSDMGLSQSVPSYVPTNGLVGWWGFNGNAQDGSGNGNHGTVNGATLTMDRFGDSAKAYNFNGSSNYIEVLDNNTLDLINQFTIGAWVNIPDYSVAYAPDPVRVFISKPRPQMGTGYMLSSITIPTNSKKYSIGLNNQTFNTGASSNDSITLNTWNYITATYDGTTCRLFRNNVLIASNTFSLSLLNSFNSLFFGKEFVANNITARWFKGKLDDIGIWNRALTPQEITNLYNSQLPTQSSLCLPTITTSSPSSVGVDTVVIGGDISNDGGSSIVLRGVCYSPSPNPNMGDQRTEDGSGTGSFNTVLRGLASSTAYYARSYAKNSNGVVVYGNEVSFTTSASLPGVRCPGTPTVTDIDGNIYNTVQIGNQCWTQSNLKTSRYRNGDVISNFFYYGNNPQNDAIFGKLYQHSSVTDFRGLCPTGWHVPSNGEWNTLINFLGGSSLAGGALKSTHIQPTIGGWSSPNTGATNSTGFTGLPGGYRNANV